MQGGRGDDLLVDEQFDTWGECDVVEGNVGRQAKVVVHEADAQSMDSRPRWEGTISHYEVVQGDVTPMALVDVQDPKSRPPWLDADVG